MRGNTFPFALVASDMDGTFLATDKQVPPRNAELLGRLARDGVPFVPCTGRSVGALPAEVVAHPATRFAVASNGAVVHDVRAGCNLMVHAMDKDAVLALYEQVRGLETTFDVFADGKIYAPRARYEAMGGFGIDGPSLAVLKRVRTPVDKDVPQIVAEARAIEKVTCFWHTERDRDGLAQAIGSAGVLSCASGHPQNFELQAWGVSKGSGLSWLCDYAGIRLQDVVAFGDEANDVSLLAAAGDGVAMANATAEARAAADHVTSSNDEAGVACYVLGLCAPQGA